MIGDVIVDFFSGFGGLGLIIALYLIFLVDSMIFPALPDFFLLMIYATDPHSLPWALTLFCVAVAGSFSGNTLLYLLVKKASVPGFIARAMQKYSDLLIVNDERILLINRVAPVLPYTGAFIAVNNWRYRLSITYIVAGAATKFGVLLMLSGTFYRLFKRGVAQNATLVLIIATIAVSLVASYIEKRRLRRPS